MDVRRRRNEYVPRVFTPEAVLTRLSPNAIYLYLFLLAKAPLVDGPLGELAGDLHFRRVGMGKKAIEHAGRELAEQGFYFYGSVRRPDGTFSRVQCVTEVPDALPKPQPTRRPVSRTTQPASRGNAGSKRGEQVRPAETRHEHAVAAGQHPFSPLGGEQVRPAETPAESDIPAAQRLFSPLGGEQVPPAETPPRHAVSAGQRLFSPLGGEQVPPAEMHPGDGVLPGQTGSPSRARTRDIHTHTQTPPPTPIDDLPAQRGPREGEGIVISIQEARSWLQRLPIRSHLRPGTSLGPVVARFLSAPGPWPKERLAKVLCEDLESAKSVEAVLQGRLKALIEQGDDVYDPAQLAQQAAAPTAGVVIDGDRVPIPALKPEEHLRIDANDAFRQARDRMRAAKSQGGPRG